MAKRFYNPGAAFEETLKFDHPTNDIREQNINSYWTVKAPEHGFFEVPTEIEFPGKDGEPLRVAVNFWQRVKRDYEKYGVVLVDVHAKLKPGDNTVHADDEAREMGDERWRESLFELVREHEKLCLEVRSAGMKPQRAKGRIAYALKVLNIEDPAQDVADVVKKREDTSKMAELEKKLAEMQRQIVDMATATAKGK